jgi:hypothetical protein
MELRRARYPMRADLKVITECLHLSFQILKVSAPDLFPKFQSLNWPHLSLRHVRKVEGLTSFRQRDPRIPQTCIMFVLFGVVCFLRLSCAAGGGFPRGLAL